MESSSEQQRVVASLYNRYCVRCHGIDGRGVWDMPDVPNFTDGVWQRSRTDEQLARLTMEGRGAVMPAFRGTFTWDESWAMARYLRSFADVPKPTMPARRTAERQIYGAHPGPARETHFSLNPPAQNHVYQTPMFPNQGRRQPALDFPNGEETQFGDVPHMGEPVMPNGFRLSHISPVSGNVSPPAFLPPGFSPPAASRPLSPAVSPSPNNASPRVASRPVFAPRAEPIDQNLVPKSSEPTTLKPRPFPPVNKTQRIPIGTLGQ